MFRKGIIAAVLIVVGTALQAARVFPADAMDKYTRHAAAEAETAEVGLIALRQEHEAFQVVFRAGETAIEDARLQPGELRSEAGGVIPASAFTLRLAHYIHLTQYIHTPAWYPDALAPYGGEGFQVPAGTLQSVFVDLAVPADAAPGIYTGIFTATADGTVTEIPVTLQVLELTLDPTPTFQSAFPIWGGDQLVAPYPGLEQDSPRARALYRRIYDFMVDYRLPPDDLPAAMMTPEAEALLADPRINSYRIPYSPDDPEAFVRVTGWLRDRGFLDKGYIYTLDEPSRDRYGECVDYARRIHETVPDARFLLTVNNGTSPRLEGAVDIWCPVLAGYDAGYFQSRQAAGDQVWWYTCVFPPPPYPSYFINDAGISPRMLSWLQARYRVEGVLYWALNIWMKWDPVAEQYVPRDVWSDPVAFPAANGDGYLIYPGKTADDDPVPTWRLEMIRQGNEDFDTLSMWRKAMAEAAAALNAGTFDPDRTVEQRVNRVAEGMMTFRRDPAALQRLRRDLLLELEGLTRGPKLLVQSDLPEGRVELGAAGEWRVFSDAEVTLTLNGVETALEADGKLRLVLDRPLRLEFTAARDGRRSVVAREYDPVEKNGETLEVFRWGRGDAAGCWDYHRAGTGEVAGSAVRSFVFDTTTDFPNVRLKLDGDTERFRWISVRIFNPNAEEVSAVMKLHAPNGLARDGAVLTAPAGGRSTLVFPFNSDENIGECAFGELEIWMFRDRPVNVIAIEGITLSVDRPEGDNVF